MSIILSGVKDLRRGIGPLKEKGVRKGREIFLRIRRLNVGNLPKSPINGTDPENDSDALRKSSSSLKNHSHDDSIDKFSVEEQQPKISPNNIDPNTLSTPHSRITTTETISRNVLLKSRSKFRQITSTRVPLRCPHRRSQSRKRCQ